MDRNSLGLIDKPRLVRNIPQAIGIQREIAL